MIDIENLTVREVRELQNLLSRRVPIEGLARNLGKQIVVLDRGFVYVGDTTIEGDYVSIEQAQNLRRWGTTRGLGELLDGPLPNTVSDPVPGRILVPMRAVIHFIEVKKGW